jgi:hypothetical protein
VTRRRWSALAAGAGASIALAEIGRRRAGGARIYPPTAALWAPGWIAERAVCSWIAVAHRVFVGGIDYRGTLLRRAATPRRELRARQGAEVQRAGSAPARGRKSAAAWEPSQMGLVFDRPQRQSAITSRRRQSSSPSSSTRVTGPRIRNGPSR